MFEKYCLLCSRTIGLADTICKHCGSRSLFIEETTDRKPLENVVIEPARRGRPPKSYPKSVYDY